MSQAIFPDIVPSSTSGNQLASLLNAFKDAVASGFSGTSRPANLQAGGYWIDTTNAGTPNFIWLFKIYTGTADITIFKMNISTNSVSITGSDDTFQVSRVSADSVGALLKLAKARITNSGQVLAGDVIGDVQFIGDANDASRPIVARIRVVAQEDETATNSGVYMTFEATSFGSATATEMARFLDGNFGVGITNPTAKIHALSTTGIKSERASDDALPAQFIARKRRIAGTTASQASDVLAAFESRSNDSSGTEFAGAKWNAIAVEGHTASVRGMKWVAQIIKSTTTTLVDAFSIGDIVESILPLKYSALIFGYQDVATTTTIANLSATKTAINFTGSTATSIQGADATGDSKVLLLHNGSSATITLLHANGTATATNRFKFANGRDITISPDTSVELFYSVTDSRWKLKSGSGSGSGGGALVAANTYGTPTTAVAGTSIAVSAVDQRQVKYMTGGGSPITMTATPQIAVPGLGANTELWLVNTDTEPLTFTSNDGKGIVTSDGRDIVLNQNEIGKFFFNGTDWMI